MDLLMEEGFNQGCHLRSTLACMVLHEIFMELNPKLKARASARKSTGEQGDDGEGGITNLMGFMDDGSALVPLIDAFFFFTTIA